MFCSLLGPNMSDWSSDEEWALIAQDVEPSDVQEQNNEQTEVQGQDDQPRHKMLR